MTLAARLRPVGRREPRPRIVQRVDLVVAVAVGTLGRRPVTQLGQRAVYAEGELVGQLLVAVPAAVGHRHPESRRARPDGIVFLVAVGATGRALDVSSRCRLAGSPAGPVAAAVDAGLQPLLDEPMAGSARVGDLRGVQRRLLVPWPAESRGRGGNWHRRPSPTGPKPADLGRERCPSRTACALSRGTGRSFPPGC